MVLIVLPWEMPVPKLPSASINQELKFNAVAMAIVNYLENKEKQVNILTVSIIIPLKKCARY